MRKYSTKQISEQPPIMVEPADKPADPPNLRLKVAGAARQGTVLGVLSVLEDFSSHYTLGLDTDYLGDVSTKNHQLHWIDLHTYARLICLHPSAARKNPEGTTISFRQSAVHAGKSRPVFHSISNGSE